MSLFEFKLKHEKKVIGKFKLNNIDEIDPIIKDLKKKFI